MCLQSTFVYFFLIAYRLHLTNPTPVDEDTMQLEAVIVATIQFIIL